jgi:hypothetical protein
LEPSLNKLEWTPEEDQLLVAKHHEFGPKWSQLTGFFQSRTDKDLKNRFNKIQRTAVKAGVTVDQRIGFVRERPVPRFLDVALSERDQSEGVEIEAVAGGHCSGTSGRPVPRRIVCAPPGEKAGKR